MSTETRQFTRADDEMIVSNSRGELSIQELRSRLRANMVTISRRATELGVRLILHRPTGRKAGSFPSTHDDLTPARIRNDKLLKRLIEVHGTGSE